ncbi:hypothetical protein CHUAL_008409 [Chamberlinius hualienensis]
MAMTTHVKGLPEANSATTETILTTTTLPFKTQHTVAESTTTLATSKLSVTDSTISKPLTTEATTLQFFPTETTFKTSKAESVTLKTLDIMATISPAANAATLSTTRNLLPESSTLAPSTVHHNLTDKSVKFTPSIITYLQQLRMPWER